MTMTYYELFKRLSSSRDELDKFISDRGLSPLAKDQKMTLEEMAFEYALAIAQTNNLDEAKANFKNAIQEDALTRVDNEADLIMELAEMYTQIATGFDEDAREYEKMLTGDA